MNGWVRRGSMNRKGLKRLAVVVLVCSLASAWIAFGGEAKLVNWKKAAEFKAGETAVKKALLESERATVNVFYLEPKQKIAAHGHTSDEIAIVVQGEAAAVIDGEHHHLKVGDLALIPEGSHAEVENVGKGKAVVIAIVTKK